LTAVVLVPLSIWFVIQVVTLADASHAQTAAWLSVPLNTVLMLTLLIALFWHSMLGLQVVVEDYVHHSMLKLVTLVSLKFVHLALGLAAIYAVLRIGFDNS
jgi:succinate dehydrogenase / fumarate reductase membrane anchor subunit